jgi:hypothetical protein
MAYDVAKLGAANIDAQSVRIDMDALMSGDEGMDALVYPDFSGADHETVRAYLEEYSNDVPPEYRRYYNDLITSEGLDPESEEDNEYALSLWLDAVDTAADDHWVHEGVDDLRPVADYLHPLDARIDAAELQGALVLGRLPVRVVYYDFGGGVNLALALTGGGMDLTWELVEAYMIAGQLPPAALARRLPHMSGRGASADDRAIIAACYESLRIAAMRAEYDRDDLRMSYGLTTAELAALGLEGWPA